jgi:hypothetical protein
MILPFMNSSLLYTGLTVLDFTIKDLNTVYIFFRKKNTKSLLS